LMIILRPSVFKISSALKSFNSRITFSWAIPAMFARSVREILRTISSLEELSSLYFSLKTISAPKQVLSLCGTQTDSLNPASGYAMLLHPDFLYKHPFAVKIKNYGFFSYTINEALYLSEKEEKIS